MARLSGYSIIVTGAGSGIGNAVARRCVAEGASVVGVIRNPKDADGLRSADILPLIGDVADPHTAERAVDAAISQSGKLDCFVANAGIWDFHKRLEKQSLSEIQGAGQEIFGINLMGAIYGARASLNALRSTQGSIIVTGSNACFRAGGGGVLYTASKFALRGAVLQMAIEFAPNVRVNGVAPGATDTAISGAHSLGHANREMNASPEKMTALEAHMPLGFVSRPEDHSSLFVTLASREESPYVTGAMWLSDGGLTCSV
jgi:NAD(P)-dependent dehydrogenase (short-subunit alcohol dehydrogenase family)